MTSMDMFTFMGTYMFTRMFTFSLMDMYMFAYMFAFSQLTETLINRFTRILFMRIFVHVKFSANSHAMSQSTTFTLRHCRM